jgi:hypothetical protein
MTRWIVGFFSLLAAGCAASAGADPDSDTASNSEALLSHWTETQQLVDPTVRAFGTRVAAFGDRAIVLSTVGSGTATKAFFDLYRRDPDGYTFEYGAEARYTGLQADVAIDDDIAALAESKPGPSKNGRVNVYHRFLKSWRPVEGVYQHSPFYDFASKIALSGTTMLVKDGPSVHVFLLDRSVMRWTEQGLLTPPLSAYPEGLESFGASLSLDGDWAAVGQSREIRRDEATLAPLQGPGRVIVYRRVGVTWRVEAILAGDSPEKSDAYGYDAFGFGASIAVAKDQLVVASPWGRDANGAITHRVYFFQRAAAIWNKTASFELSSAPDAVAISGTTAVVTTGATARIFERSAAGWTPRSEVQPALWGARVAPVLAAALPNADRIFLGAPTDLNDRGMVFVYEKGPSILEPPKTSSGQVR